jgi:hypothetical protein
VQKTPYYNARYVCSNDRRTSFCVIRVIHVHTRVKNQEGF